MTAQPVKTPCVKVCFVDPGHGHCLGCFRTLQEIGCWSMMGEDEREAVMADLPARKDKFQLAPPPS